MAKQHFTAGQLSILVHMYWSTEPYQPSGDHFFNMTIEYFKEHGLAEDNKDAAAGRLKFKLTDRGRAHVETLMCIPLPTQEWVGYRVRPAGA